MTRTLNQIIKDKAFEAAGWVRKLFAVPPTAKKIQFVEYTPKCDCLNPDLYFEAGFVRGAEWFKASKNLHPVNMWTINVFDDYESEPRTYTVPATSDRDARLMALILDKGLEDAKYGNGSIVERGEMELALIHTEVVTAPGS